jgi:hypothetical protein
MADDSGTKSDKYEKRLTDAVDYLRGNVKWTLVAFGAIGTTLLAGSQLSNLGKFEWNEPRLWIALLFAALALGAAAYAVRCALAVAYTGYTELYSLETADIKYVERNSALLQGFESIQALRRAYEKCIRDRHRDLTADEKDPAALENNEIWFAYLDGLVDDVLSYIRHDRVRRQVERSRTELTWASMIAAVSLVGFAWAANPKVEQRVVVLKAVAAEARLKLTEAGKKVLEPVLGAQCIASGMIDIIALDAAAAKHDVISLKTKDCPVARLTIDDALGSLLGASP